jgi:signal transduction histidine kinase
MSCVQTIVRFLAAIILVLPNLALLAANEATPANLAIPLRIVIGQTLRPGEENRMAEAEGTVTFVGRQGRATYLELSSEAGYMPVNIARGAGYLADLLLWSRIQVRGVCTAVHSSADGKIVGSLSATGRGDITILQLPEETWRRYPVCRVGAAARTNAGEQMLHLCGQVQSVQPEGSFLLADSTGRVTVESRLAQSEMAGRDVEVLGVMQSRGSNKVFHSVSFRPFTETTNQASLPTRTTTEQIRWLNPDEASRQYPVKVRGVITFVMARHGADVGGDLQDATGGIFLWQLWKANPAATNSGIRAGDYCEVEGVTSPGDFSPMILCRKVTVLGEGQFPEATHPGWDELIRGGLDAQWVEVKGVVLSASGHNLELGMKGGRIQCSSIPGSVERFLGAIVRVRGVVYASHDAARRLTDVRITVPSQKFISVDRPAPDDPFSTPVMHARDLLTYNPTESAFRQVKVAGQLVHVRNAVGYVMDGTNGMRLMAEDNINASPGDIVEAVGFPEIDSPFDKPLLTLREALVRKLGHGPLPAAEKIAPDDLLDREHDATLVRLDSRLLNVSLYPAEQVLELEAGTRIYRARLDLVSGRIPPLQAGSLLELTGVYAISSDRTVPFELLLNSPADVRVLELPSWWTVQHALFVVCAMALVILLAVVWISLLHQQVGRRTVQLSTANQSLKSEIAERKRAENELVQTRLQHLVELERTRIARDLHDDLGSRVTRVVLMLDELALQNRLPGAEAPEHPLGISATAREVIQSLDETVWAVNPRNDTLPHLFNYFSHFAIEFLKAANVRCRLDFPDHPPARIISAEARHNLFLAVKEALNNAVRHARATEVWLRASVSETSLALTVEDNGRGFEQASNHPSTDGLRNMRQRMEEIGGQFSIASAAKTGTNVTLTFFWPARQPK